MCANGSIANRAGFDVDENCPLTTIVDGEIVVAPQNKKTDGIINALISFDKYFQNDPDFKMYNIFSGHKNLLFKVGFHLEFEVRMFRFLKWRIFSGFLTWIGCTE